MSPDEFEKWSRFRGRGIFRFVLVLGGMVGGAWAAWMFPVVVLCRVVRDHPIRWIATAFGTAFFGLIFGLVTSVGLWVQLAVRYRFTAARQREANRDASTLVLLPRRSGGRLFSLASAISLLLATAALVLLIRSEDRRDEVRFRWHGASYEIASERGRLSIDNFPEIHDAIWRRAAEMDALTARFRQLAEHLDGTGAPNDRKKWGLLVQQYQSLINWRPPAGIQHTIPDWLVALVALVLPFAWAWKWDRRRRRITAGLCSTCGYDLRASKDRCPECGTPITSNVGTSS